MIQGQMIRPEKANTNQLFSHCHAVRRFIGAAKLPCSMPARTTTASPQTTFPLISAPYVNRQNMLTRVSGENEPPGLSPSREISRETHSKIFGCNLKDMKAYFVDSQDCFR